jgi:high-affinity nickel permease
MLHASMSLLKHVHSLDLGHVGYGLVAVALVIWPGAAILCEQCIQPKERT